MILTADLTCWGTLWSAIAAESFVRWFNEFRHGDMPSRASLREATGPQ